jgi:hypothetical protein
MRNNLEVEKWTASPQRALESKQARLLMRQLDVSCGSKRQWLELTPPARPPCHLTHSERGWFPFLEARRLCNLHVQRNQRQLFVDNLQVNNNRRDFHCHLTSRPCFLGLRSFSATEASVQMKWRIKVKKSIELGERGITENKWNNPFFCLFCFTHHPPPTLPVILLSFLLQ